MEKDLYLFSYCHIRKYFNPLSRMEKDSKSWCPCYCICNKTFISIHSLAWRKTVMYSYRNYSFHISIHSLAWRKTNCLWGANPNIRYFNPLSRMEKDFAGVLQGCWILIFQSTLSHGERLPYKRRSKSKTENFNPLSRMEKDIDGKDFNIKDVISIHSLAWRKTMTYARTHTLSNISIHSLAWRKTSCPVS